MIIERSMSGAWLSNTHLVADDQGIDAMMIDAGGPVEPSLKALDSQHRDVFTGDTLFEGSGGGVGARGATGYDEIVPGSWIELPDPSGEPV